MRHKKTYRKLNKPSSHRIALLKNLIIALIQNEKVITTEAKARELKKLAEKIITMAKTDTLHSRRQVRRLVNNEDLIHKLFHDVAPRYENRQGGYTRLTQIGPRVGDAANLAQLALAE